MARCLLFLYFVNNEITTSFHILSSLLALCLAHQFIAVFCEKKFSSQGTSFACQKLTIIIISKMEGDGHIIST